MGDLNVIDQFLSSFSSYIDSGFGLLGPDLHSLSAILIGIDVTLAALFWATGSEQDIMIRFVRKILYVGAFAYILTNFASLSKIIFNSFSALGLKAGGGTMSAADLLKPGKLAGIGFSAAWPLLQQASQLTGFTTFFDNVLEIVVLVLAWAIVVLAFFILAVQMFVCILEFKLTTLAGFVLVPFAFWNRTSFLAERVLGGVVSSGIKVMVLAVIVGIGSNYFAEFTAALQGKEPDIGQAMSLVLASLAMFGLGIYGPSIASGLVAGAPQLGAGAVVGTAVGVAGAAMAAASVGGAAAGAALGAVRAGTAMGAATKAAYGMGQEAAGSSSISAGLSGVGRAAGGAARARMSDAFGLRSAAESGRNAAWSSMTGQAPAAANDAPDMPAWARAVQSQQSARHVRQTVAQTLREGDSGGAAATPDISEKED
ncbi:P-type conjugative transfer protein TrbL [Sphingomonas oryzagri]|uniref:P-type conjugative transfer protein TrbL n=1 Tax=Sphingomonas oryzagri TaxID=3042314 RepID=A0ABT6N167_9SPHN|nr:P-type conjugative transfer protein TrbL [Sphingomonas oryzagri]MDH7638091.1 P-type conjugative transfer protein TrbL [Sphingomonas oryzagri]